MPQIREPSSSPVGESATPPLPIDSRSVHQSSDGPLGDFSDANLRALAQGCTEFTCIYHGRYNFELRRRTP